MAKGDVVEVQLHGEARRLVAEANGRYFQIESEKEQGLNWIVVIEFTRGGTQVRKSKFRAEEVVAIHHDRQLRE